MAATAGRGTTPTPTRHGGPVDARAAAVVCLGGSIGAVARLGLDDAIPFDGHGWPWATFSANVVGTILLAFVVTRLQERLPPTTYRRPALGAGFCGALTTFSTFQVELIELVRGGESGLAVAYAACSVGIGLACAIIVTKATRR